MKVSIIGGGGLVGSMTAFALQCGGAVSRICLIDANKDMAEGQALDLLHGSSLVADQRISAGDMSDVATSNVGYDWKTRIGLGFILGAGIQRLQGVTVTDSTGQTATSNGGNFFNLEFGVRWRFL